MSICIIVQARLGSKRLPKKVLKPILMQPMLFYTLNRLQFLSSRAQIVVATTTLKQDQAIVEFCNQSGIACFQGDPYNVLKRYYDCAKWAQAETVVRVTGDCPLIDPKLLIEMLKHYSKLSCDLLTNVQTRSYPKGLDIEIFSFDALKTAYQNASTAYQKEHVTPYFYEHSEQFQIVNYQDEEDYSEFNVSVDTLEDFKQVEVLIKKYYSKNPYFGLKELKQHFSLNNEPYLPDSAPSN